MAIRAVMSGRWFAAITLIVAFSLGIIAQRSGLVESIGKYRGDIVFLTQQHIKLVAVEYSNARHR